jgi:CheY-like chemotaxis protein
MAQREAAARHTRAWRERQAELGSLPPAATAPTGVNILLIEDNPADVTLFRHALEAAALPCQLTVLTDRRDVEAFVRHGDPASLLPPPRLLITDCMIPGMEVEEVIATLRSVPASERLPVILFSSLPEEEGERRRLRCGATLFVHKPFELEAFVVAVSTLVQRWGGGGHGGDSDPGQEARDGEEGEGYKTDTE